MMELKAGYKQTEVGVIPEDWNVELLDNLTIKVGSGITPTGGETVYKKDGRPLVRSQNIGWGRLLLEDIAFIDDEIHQTFPNTEIKLNDVFLNISGASIGRSSFASEKLVGGNVNQHVCIIRTIEKRLNPLFLNLFLLSKNGQKQIDSFQSGGNRQGLNIGQIKTFKIPLPPTIIEQAAIATALSDVDALISELNSEIAKKRLIKQGAMQQLLSGKKRLAGFSGEWESKRLGDICSYQNGTALEKFFNNNDGFQVISIGNYSSNGIYIDNSTYIGYEYLNVIKKFILNKNDLTMILNDKTSQGTIIGRVLLIDSDSRFVFNQRTMRLTPKKEVVPLFLYHSINGDYLHSMLFGLAKTGTQIYINTADVIDLNIPLPPTIEEQTAIAQILSDMDNEIAALEKRRAKTQQIKHGMMQELLTGKTRLI